MSSLGGGRPPPSEGNAASKVAGSKLAWLGVRVRVGVGVRVGVRVGVGVRVRVRVRVG